MKLRIVVNPDGTTTVKVEGVQGPGCAKHGLELAQMLGTVTSDLKTAEYYQTPAKQTAAQKAKEVA